MYLGTTEVTTECPSANVIGNNSGVYVGGLPHDFVIHRQDTDRRLKVCTSSLFLQLYRPFCFGGCGIGLDASVFNCRPSRGAVVPRLGLASELVRLGLISVSSSEGLGLGLASA